MFNKVHALTITSKFAETAEFYKTLFGFTEAFTSDWYIQLAHANGAELGIMMPNVSNQPDFLQKEFSGDGMIFTFETDDATAMHKDLLGKGAVIAYDLADEEWGQRHFIVRDPAGVYVDVVQYL